MVDKKMSFTKFIRLYVLYAKMDLAWFLRDTKFCLLAICADFISNIAAVTGIFLLAYRFDGVGDMDKFEVLFMMGYVTVITGVFQTFFSGCNTGHISRRIGRGQFEHISHTATAYTCSAFNRRLYSCIGKQQHNNRLYYYIGCIKKPWHCSCMVVDTIFHFECDSDCQHYYFTIIFVFICRFLFPSSSRRDIKLCY